MSASMMEAPCGQVAVRRVLYPLAVLGSVKVAASVHNDFLVMSCGSRKAFAASSGQSKRMRSGNKNLGELSLKETRSGWLAWSTASGRGGSMQLSIVRTSINK